MIKAAIYARVSTNEGKQHLENQIAACREFCKGQAAPTYEPAGEWKIANIYMDEESGASADRPAFRQMMRDAALSKFRALVVFDLSRFTREGPGRAFTYIQKLKEYGVEFVSVREPLFRTSGAAGEVFIAIAAYVAAEERKTMRARVLAGIDRARREGKRLGRPRKVFIDPSVIAGLIGRGLSSRHIAHLLGTSKSSAERAIKSFKEQRQNAIQPQA